MNDEGAYRTAQAITGLVKTLDLNSNRIVQRKKKLQSKKNGK